MFVLAGDLSTSANITFLTCALVARLLNALFVTFSSGCVQLAVGIIFYLRCASNLKNLIVHFGLFEVYLLGKCIII